MKVIILPFVNWSCPNPSVKIKEFGNPSAIGHLSVSNVNTPFPTGRIMIPIFGSAPAAVNITELPEIEFINFRLLTANVLAV